MNRNITEHTGVVSAEARERILGQRGCVIWLTGLSGSGKSTIASALEARLVAEGRLAVVLDGDNLRHGLNSDLGFSAADRTENVRRVGEVAALFAQAGIIAITSLISPSREGRERARASAQNGRFIEVFVDAPLSQCEARDPKGLYRRARAGEIPEFTGISAPYEAPLFPELIIRSAEQGIQEAVEAIHALLNERHYLATEGPTA